MNDSIKSSKHVELLGNSDIFDFYGAEFLLRLTNNGLEESDRRLLVHRVDEIHTKYVHAVRERIKSEFRFLGLDVPEGFTINKLLDNLQKLTQKEFEDQAENMMRGGSFNAMNMLLQANQLAGNDISDVAGKFGMKAEKPKNPADSTVSDIVKEGSILNNPKWHEISEAFLKLEEASDTKAKISTIDFLNTLQHNSFHLLIDLQTGRMLDDQSSGEMHGRHNEAVDVVKEALDIKFGAKSPMEFASRMSKDIRKLMSDYRGMN